MESNFEQYYPFAVCCACSGTLKRQVLLNRSKIKPHNFRKNGNKMAVFFSFSYSSNGFVRRDHMPRGACSSFLFTDFLLPLHSSQAVLNLAGCDWSREPCEREAQTLQPQPANPPQQFWCVCGQGSVYLGEHFLRFGKQLHFQAHFQTFSYI